MVSENFQNFIMKLDDLGITDVLLPFVLIFVIVFAILQKTKILGDGKKNLNVAVAIVVGLLVVIPHVTGKYPPNANPVEIIKDSLPQVSIFLVAIVFLLILLGVFGQDVVMLGVTMPGWITLFSILVILIIFGGAAGWWSDGFSQWLEDAFGTEAIAIAIMILVFGVIIAWITKERKEEEKTWLQKLGVDLDKLFKK